MGRSLYLKIYEIYEGDVPAKDSSHPYVAVTVGDETAGTPLDGDATDWAHTFENVDPTTRIKFHVHDRPDLDDDLGELQVTVGQFLYNNEDKRQTIRAGDSSLEVKAKWQG
ncbi:hypothetical protein ACIQVK_46865 [Streptomyces sp. NPDC090493]|uniref:hypothetical protein n=1 Tax=Streptomyces sp. NPDC090493 TaxID=3365964 RepID=UPI003818E286